jgi:hypothetical protein
MPIIANFTAFFGMEFSPIYICGENSVPAHLLFLAWERWKKCQEGD